MTLPRPASRLAIAALLACVVACNESKSDAPPVLPPLEGMEPAVAAKIRQTHEAVLADPSAATLSRHAKTLHAHDLWREAVPVYVAASERASMPEKFELLYLAGHAAMKHDPVRAVELLERAASLRDDYVPLHLHLGYIFEVEHRLEDARRRYQHAADLRRSAPRQEPKDYLLVQALVGLGRIALAEGKVAEAVSSLEKARGIEPAHQEALAAIAAAYARAGRKNDAANASAGVGDLEGRSGFPDPLVTSVYAEGASYAVLESVGLAALRAQAYGEVLAIFDRAIAIRPDDPDALLARAQALLGLNRPADAEPLLDRVLDKRPGNVSALMFRGGCSMARNDFAGAVHFLKRALAIDPTRSGARLNLSKAHRGLRQPAEARPHVEFLLQRMPHNSAFRLELAHLLVDEGKPTEALSEVERVLGAEPSNQQALALKAKLAR